MGALDAQHDSAGNAGAEGSGLRGGLGVREGLGFRGFGFRVEVQGCVLKGFI